MIESVTIANLRGVQGGLLEDISPLTVLFGPNSAGKSTVLEAILIGSSRRNAAAVGRVVRRRLGLRHGARWLLWRGAEEGPASVNIRWRGGEERASKLTWLSELEMPPSLTNILAERGAKPPYSAIEAVTHLSGTSFTSRVAFGEDNFYAIDSAGQPLPPGSGDAWLIDTGRSSVALPLHELYSRITERGQNRALQELLRPLVPGMDRIEILTENDIPVLHVAYEDHSVPAALVGEGVQSLFRLGFELVARKTGTTALLEEPESHQHPAAIGLSAQLIVGAVRKGVQVILTTHSLELLDRLLSELSDSELPLLSVHRLQLRGPQLQSIHISGPDVAMRRVDIGEDLR